MAKELIETDVRDLIVEHLKADERSLKWLSKKTKIAYGTLYSCFMEKRFTVSEKNLNRINKILGTTFKINLGL